MAIKQQQQTTVVAAFQTWRNGNNIQVSGLYTGDEVSDFIEKHNTSGTFATLHTFTNMAQARAMYEGFVEDERYANTEMCRHFNLDEGY